MKQLRIQQRQVNTLGSLTIEEQVLTVKRFVRLPGVDQHSQAVAVVFANDSYAILASPSGQLLEYCLSADSFPYVQTSDNYYGGPLNYYQRVASGYLDLLTKEIIPFQLSDRLDQTLDQTATSAENQATPLTNENKRYDQWVGLPESRFYPYRNWVTPSGYLCGTYASTVLLAYYQDYIDESIIPDALRMKGENRHEELATCLRRLIQPLGLPTIPFQVGFGLSRYFDRYGINYRARTTLVGSWNRAIKRIQQGKPVEVGILKVLGSTYGNHWVVAYAYLEKADGSRFYKVHDNWGNYNKVINASWGNGTVSLP